MKPYYSFRQVKGFLDRTLTSSTFTWREILDLTFPCILDSMSIMFIGTLITALISQNGADSVAAVSLVSPIANLICCMFNGVGAGGTIVVAQCKGKGDTQTLECGVGMVLWLTVAVGVLTCLPFLLFPRQILTALYQEAERAVMEKAVVYLSGCVWTILVFTVYTAVFSVLRGLGESKKCLVLSVIINVAYLLFSILFLNFLHMDIQGSVLALLLARIVGAGTAITALFLYHPPLPFHWQLLFSFDKSIFRSTLQISIPLGLEQIFSSCGSLVSQMFMITLGTAAVAVHSIASSLMGFLYSSAASISSVAVAVVGRCAGAGNQEEAYFYGRRCCQMARILLAAACVIFYPLLPLMLKPYRLTEEMLALAIHLLLCSIPGLLLFWPLSNTMPSVLRSVNDTLYPSVVSLIVLWTVNIGLGYELAIPMKWGLWGVWAAMWLSWVVRAGLFRFRYKEKAWHSTLDTARQGG